MSTESNFSFTTKVAGDLLTVRGDTVAEFESNLNGILSRAEAIAPALTHLQGFGAAAPLTGPQQPVATPTVTMPPTTPAPPPTPPAAPTSWTPAQPQAPAAPQHLCKHGEPMKHLQGVSKSSGKAYNFWACARDRSEQCDAKVWVN